MFKEIQHTADVGLYIESTSFSGLFYDAAMGLMSISNIEPSNENKIHIVNYKNKSIDKETLLVDWLNFLIYQMDKNFYLISTTIRIYRNYLKARCYFRRLKNRSLLVKSATFHNLQVFKQGKLINTVIVFDV